MQLASANLLFVGHLLRSMFAIFEQINLNLKRDCVWIRVQDVSRRKGSYQIRWETRGLKHRSNSIDLKSDPILGNGTKFSNKSVQVDYRYDPTKPWLEKTTLVQKNFSIQSSDPR